MDGVKISLYGIKTVQSAQTLQSAVQGHPRSLILVPIEIAGMTSY